MNAATETPEAGTPDGLLIIPPPEGPFDREAALRFLSWEHAGYLTILGHAHALGVEDEELRAALSSLAMDVGKLTESARGVLETGEPVEIGTSFYWDDNLDRSSQMSELVALATSQQTIFRDAEELLEGPGYAAYARLGAYLRRRLAEDREAAR